jgi:hypothetical protein
LGILLKGGGGEESQLKFFGKGKLPKRMDSSYEGGTKAIFPIMGPVGALIDQPHKVGGSNKKLTKPTSPWNINKLARSGLAKF